MRPEVLIRPLSPSDHSFFKESVVLLNRTQGKDLFPPDYIELLVGREDAKVFAAFDNSMIVAIGVAQIISDYEYYRPFQENISEELSGKKVGSFSTMAVHENYQGMGIGQRISNARMDWLMNQNCDVVVGVSWVSGLRHTSDRVFEKTGFKKIKHVPEFYKQSSMEKPFHCPGCHSQPCLCGAIFYKKILKRSEP